MHYFVSVFFCTDRDREREYNWIYFSLLIQNIVRPSVPHPPSPLPQRKVHRVEMTDFNSPYDEKTVANTLQYIGKCSKCCTLDEKAKWFFLSLVPRNLWVICVNTFLIFHAACQQEFAFLEALVSDRCARSEFVISLFEEMSEFSVDCTALDLYAYSALKLMSLEVDRGVELSLPDKIGSQRMLRSCVVMLLG